ncbi:MAG: TusE/DsrC/DsvC family sulfur relay protein [Tenuifilum sp.]|jgi:tRNA 2-thiouridine synthesizing protein E|uniref:TusE/DsrC/DsvC family sulfur relay protein n=1 Tax=Tenuifilum TaxID=2760873 RepID=UPI0019BC3FD9|nr:TusE/DsrC/DsvC family sulfur relay protein [Bacteroidales bacterium]HOK60241.1 TusE/DsrC/DsvC family sulfur relay protein [Tenuifilum sp.]MBP7170036.1 TusE/DsrC/DsvC family sulfur relay protein [Bacteroidales bacterium]MBP9028884.1 TusE/DsrC/DsvC family sulfur relay protein [Bacteroidales bacterium]HOK86472.1 TusE/DsrC/DsvC family sulfur relay protein [Tenuifilum sp.]
MAEKVYAGKSVSVTDDGYLTDPNQWTKEVAIEIAKEEGIELTDKHFAVIEFIREKTLKGEALTIRTIGKSGLVDTKGFYELFPGAPLKKASRIAGIAKPSSCV